MASVMIRSIFLFFLFLGSPALSSDFKFLQGLNNPDMFQIAAPELGRSFNIYVRLPTGYNESKSLFPTMYLLDGGHIFPMLSTYYQYLAFGEEAPDMIIVGISYGADAFDDGNYRGTDFTAKAESRAHYGGASMFQTFLKDQLLPHIEKKYRSDPAKRMIFGQSIGGQFVLYTAQTRPSLFWGHIASNPALHRNLEFFLQNLSPKTKTDSLLFVSSGTEDDERFRVPAVRWMEHWKQAPDKPWRLKTIDLPGHSHFSAAPAAFRAGLKWFFSDMKR